jgi:hypothetical protein
MEQEPEPSPDTTPEAQIQELRDQQTNTMLTVLATLANIEGITLDEAEWPYLLDCENAPQRYRATVTFWVP